jgi:4-hydroxy-3-methylbut-2-enyl diphosphate reductase
VDRDAAAQPRRGVALEFAIADPADLPICSPRRAAYCAGVDRAVQTVERALEIRRARVRAQGDRAQQARRRAAARARRDLRRAGDRGARGRGVRVLRPRRRAPACARTPPRAAADDRRDLPARHEGPPSRRVRFAAEGYTIVLVGHDGHEEVEGTMGEAPEHIVLVQSEATSTSSRSRTPSGSPTSRRRRSRSTRPLDPRPPARALPGDRRSAHRRHLLRDHQPPGGRQAAGGSCDLVLVIGSRNSSNSVRLVEVARDTAPDSHLIDNAGEVARGVARGQARGRHLLRRQRARGARAGARRALPRPRRDRHLRVRRDARGRPLHAAQGDPPAWSRQPPRAGDRCWTGRRRGGQTSGARCAPRPAGFAATRSWQASRSPWRAQRRRPRAAAQRAVWRSCGAPACGR